MDEDILTTSPTHSNIEEWEQDCLRWRGVVLCGEYAHWCPQWDALPMDETCPEWPCGCFDDETD